MAGTEIYVVVWIDKIITLDVLIFSKADKAIEFAKRKSRECDRGDGVDETLTEAQKREGVLYHGRYGEDAYMYVIPKIVDEE